MAIQNTNTNTTGDISIKSALRAMTFLRQTAEAQADVVLCSRAMSRQLRSMLPEAAGTGTYSLGLDPEGAMTFIGVAIWDYVTRVERWNLLQAAEERDLRVMEVVEEE